MLLFVLYSIISFFGVRIYLGIGQPQGEERCGTPQAAYLVLWSIVSLIILLMSIFFLRFGIRNRKEIMGKIIIGLVGLEYLPIVFLVMVIFRAILIGK